MASIDHDPCPIEPLPKLRVGPFGLAHGDFLNPIRIVRPEEADTFPASPQREAPDKVVMTLEEVREMLDIDI